jgi:fructose-1-phosphate kinase PfkB-like protein
LAKPGNLVIFCGSLPPGVGGGDFAKLLDICLSGGAKVAVDASGEALRATVGKKLWLLKPNSLELAELTGKKFANDAELLAAAKSLTADVENVLLSCGGDGAYLVRNDGVMRCLPGMAVEVVNTVGCGDTLLGAFVGGLCCESDYRGALMHGVACASACAANPQTAKFEEDLVDEILEHVVVNEVK